MNKNHFVFGFFGNKREEVHKIYDTIKDKINDIKYIVEPYAGSAAVSYYISTLHPKKFTYILNDNDNMLIELYKIMKNKKKSDIFLKKINNILNDDTMNKAKYMDIVRQKNIYSWFISHKVFSIRPGLYPAKGYKYKEILFDAPIINFLRTENVIIKKGDATKIYIKYSQNKDAFIFMDPPYMQSCNDFYASKNLNIYEYVANNNFSEYKAKDRKSTRLNSSHMSESRMPSSA